MTTINRGGPPGATGAGRGPVIAVFLADDNLLVREGVRALLATHAALRRQVRAERLPPALVKGRHAPVGAYRIGAAPVDGG
jgi:hypothetical protein